MTSLKAAAEPSELGPGRRLGRYRIDQALGRGAMGQVFLCEDTLLKQPICIKVLHPALSSHPEAVERFNREIVLARRIVHRGVCRMYDIHDENGVRFITMEYVNGTPLRDLLSTSLPPGRSVHIAAGICDALAAAHDVGVIHRDLKPRNVMVGPNDEVTILDFGIATALDVESSLTMPGVAVGTRHYIAPEVWAGRPATPRSDLFGVGVILYNCLTGRMPWNVQNEMMLLDAMRAPPPLASSVRPDVPPALDAATLRALAFRPEERWPDARTLASALRASLAPVQPSRFGPEDRVGTDPTVAIDTSDVVDAEDAATRGAAGATHALSNKRAPLAMASAGGSAVRLEFSAKGATDSMPPSPSSSASPSSDESDLPPTALVQPDAPTRPRETLRGPPASRPSAASTIPPLARAPAAASPGSAVDADIPPTDLVPRRDADSVSGVSDDHSRAMSSDSGAALVAAAGGPAGAPRASGDLEWPGFPTAADGMTSTSTATVPTSGHRLRAALVAVGIVGLVAAAVIFSLRELRPSTPDATDATSATPPPSTADAVARVEPPTESEPRVSADAGAVPAIEVDVGEPEVGEEGSGSVAAAGGGGSGGARKKSAVSSAAREKERFSAARNGLERALESRGLIYGDDAELDKLRALVEKQARARNWDAATETAEAAQKRAGDVNIDKNFVKKKLARFNAKFDEVKNPEKRARLDAIVAPVFGHLAAGRNVEANKALSKGFGAL